MTEGEKAYYKLSTAKSSWTIIDRRTNNADECFLNASKLIEQPNNKDQLNTAHLKTPKRLKKVETVRKFQIMDSRLIVMINNQMHRTIPETATSREPSTEDDLFYEDKGSVFESSEIPKYTTKKFSTTEVAKGEVKVAECSLKVDNDSKIISLDTSNESSDDEAVIFISEEKNEKNQLVEKKPLTIPNSDDQYPTITRLYNYHVLGILADGSLKSPEKKQDPSQVADTPQCNEKPGNNLLSSKMTAPQEPLINGVPKKRRRRNKRMRSVHNSSVIAGTSQNNKKFKDNLQSPMQTPAAQINEIPKKSSRKRKRKSRSKISSNTRRMLNWDNLVDQHSSSIQNRYQNSCQTPQYDRSYVNNIPNLMSMNLSDPRIRKVQRIIIIDGSNVAMGEHKQFDRVSQINFNVEGLKKCIDNFENLGFRATAVVPAYRMRRGKSSNWPLINELKLQGRIVCSPSKSNDQRVILNAAIKLDAAVVSNDLFRDLSNENLYFREFIQNRIIRFMWLFDQIFITEDPYGRHGPTLENILYRTERCG